MKNLVQPSTLNASLPTTLESLNEFGIKIFENQIRLIAFERCLVWGLLISDCGIGVRCLL